MSRFSVLKTKAPTRPRPFVRIAFETLEDRTAPALFNVLASQTFAGINNNGFVGSGDWDGNGKRDLVLANYGDGTAKGAPNSITLVYGNGNGTFGSPTTIPTGGTADSVSYIAIADLDGDGDLDFVSANTNQTTEAGTFTVYENVGFGAFQAKAAVSSNGNRASWVGVADFNNDGKLDLAFTNIGNSASAAGRTISIFKGDGALGFSGLFSVVIPDADGVPMAAAIADFNNNNTADIAVTFATVPPDEFSEQLPGAVRIYNGAGDGSLVLGSSYESGGPLPVNIVAADVNGDSKIDLVVANAGDPDLSHLYANYGKNTAVGIMLNGGTGVFGPTNKVSIGLTSAFSVSVADVNIDGKMDLVVADTGKPDSLFATGTPGNVVVYTQTVTNPLTFLAEANSPYSTTKSAAQFLVVDSFTSNTDNTPDVVVAHESKFIVALTNTTAVAAPVSTTTSLVSNANPSTYAQNVTFTATVTPASGGPATGTVTFLNGATTMGVGTLTAGVATYSTSTLNAGGPYSFTARYEGTTGFTTSKSSAVLQTVNKTGSSTSVLASPNPTTVGTNVTLTAKVTSLVGTPTGTVTFLDNGVSIGTGILTGGQATLSSTAFSVGTHPITATYAGDTNFAASSDLSPDDLVVNAAAKVNSFTTITSSKNPSIFSNSVTFTAVVTSGSGNPTGNVFFFDNNVQVGSGGLSFTGGQNQATFTTSTFTVGTHPIQAKYQGDTGYNTSQSVILDQIVNKIGVAHTLISSSNPSLFGNAVTFTSTLVPALTTSGFDPSGTVTFKTGITTLGTGNVQNVGGAFVASFQTTTLAVGATSIFAEYSGDLRFAAVTSNTVNQTVNPTSPPPPPPPPPPALGYREFTAGAGSDSSAIARFYNKDGVEQFNVNMFPGFTGGVRVTTADFNGDGVADVVGGTGPGADSAVRILDGVTKAELFFVNPFETGFLGGVFVAAGDIDGDGLADLVITPDEGGGPRVSAFKTTNAGGGVFTFNRQFWGGDFFGIADTKFFGGARAAIGDVNGDGKGDLLIAAGFGGGPRLAVFDGTKLSNPNIEARKMFGDFFVFEQSLRNGVFITSGDIDGDGYAEVIAGGGPGGGPRVFALSGKGLVNGQEIQKANFFGGDPGTRGGIRVVARDLDGDNFSDIVIGYGVGAGSRVIGYRGSQTPPNGVPGTIFNFEAFPSYMGGVFVG